jgi:hypothetical protein
MLPEGDSIIKRRPQLIGAKIETQVAKITPFILQIKAK